MEEKQCLLVHYRFFRNKLSLTLSRIPLIKDILCADEQFNLPHNIA